MFSDVIQHVVALNEASPAKCCIAQCFVLAICLGQHPQAKTVDVSARAKKGPQVFKPKTQFRDCVKTLSELLVCGDRELPSHQSKAKQTTMVLARQQLRLE